MKYGRTPLREVVTRSDIQSVNVARGEDEIVPPPNKPNPRILRIVDEIGMPDLAQYYIRIPDTAYRAYGDLLQSCDSRGTVWAGNKITYVASDAVSAAFQYEIRLDVIVITDVGGMPRSEGAIELKQSLQEIFGGIYFPIPSTLESFLVPDGNEEIRLELHCDWIDMRTARHWLPSEIMA